MSNQIIVLLLTASAILFVTLVATVGAVASRKFSFHYGWLSIPSFIIYIVLGYHISSYETLTFVLIFSGIVGGYDAIVGWNLCLRFNAYLGPNDEVTRNISTSSRLTTMLVFTGICGYIGFWLNSSHII